ncbi:MAG: class I SAM-dependent methyltransferase [Halanaeroarchaeum sp.]
MPHPLFGDRSRVARTYRYLAWGYDRLRPLFTGFEHTRDEYFGYLSLADDDRVLDVGCGTGESLRRTLGDERDVHGVDLSPSQLAYAREKAALRDATLSVADATRLPYRNGVFDVVLSIGSLPYVPDVDAALEEAHRVTGPDGELFVVGPKYPEGRVARRIADALMHFLRPERFATRCRRAGWRDVRTHTVHMDWLGRDALVVQARA